MNNLKDILLDAPDYIDTRVAKLTGEYRGFGFEISVWNYKTAIDELNNNDNKPPDTPSTRY